MRSQLLGIILGIIVTLGAKGADLKISSYPPVSTIQDRYLLILADPSIADYKASALAFKGYTLNGTASNAFFAFGLYPGTYLTNIVIFTDQYRTQAVTISAGGLISITNNLGGVYFSGGTITVSNLVATDAEIGVLYPTNMLFEITAWGGPTNTLSFDHQHQQYTASTDMAVTGFANFPINGLEEPVMLSITNSAATNCTLWVTASGVTTDDSARSYSVTSHGQRKFSFNKDDMGYHLVSRPFQ